MENNILSINICVFISIIKLNVIMNAINFYKLKIL